MKFQGYVIQSGSVAMDEDKVNAVKEFPPTHTVKELQHFLGFTNFYCHFFRNFC